MFYWVAKNRKFSGHKWRFDKTDSHCSVALSKSNVFLLIYCKLRTNSMAKGQLLYMGCLLTREREQKKNLIFIFKIPASAYERVSAHWNVQIQSLTGR